MFKVMFQKKYIKMFLAVALLVLCSGLLAQAAGHPEPGTVEIGKSLPIWSIIPFVGMLLSIAIVPLVKGDWWEKNELWVAIFWSLTFLVPFAVAYGFGEMWYQTLEMLLLDYLPFLGLLFGLFVVAGGIVLKGTIVGKPKTNLILLLIGTVLASWVGTTGAAMLMIRPLIRANAWREKKAHVIVFCIFMVANMGGCLTPVGDPPLFMGYLRNVPFFWTMKLFPILLLNVVILSAVFLIIDTRYYKKDLAAGKSPQDMTGNQMEKEPIRIEGAHNFIFLLMIVGAVLLQGFVTKLPAFMNQATGVLTGIHIYHDIVFPWNDVLELAIILLAAFLSLKTTKPECHEANEFNYGAIAEVAKLFLGIFLTMIPALALLKSNGAALGITHPAQFFWASGALSSFLDNTPTYLVFLTTAGAVGFTQGVATKVGIVQAIDLMAISAGSVFMGANTYIGNAPNFMVKSIAEENGVKMPSFFGYMGWALAILEPVFIIDMFIWFW
ncbi:MAG: sodium:proton antiporter [Eubacteriaceae bacterium]|jgi:Na+/H+ antiporter NhaD/arsenite permease-like protein|nr:sodium:proton antiporter [Eubacteriaceae bacterium]